MANALDPVQELVQDIVVFIHAWILVPVQDWNHAQIHSWLTSWLDCRAVMQGIHDSPSTNSSCLEHEVHENSGANSFDFSLSCCVNSCTDSCMGSSKNPNKCMSLSHFIWTAVLNQRPCRCICTGVVAAAGREGRTEGRKERQEGRKERQPLSVCPLNLSHCHFFSQSRRCHRHYRQAMNPAGSANSDGYRYWHWSKRIS